MHIVQPIERVNRKLVVFGEGQLPSSLSSACCPVQTQDGMLVLLHISVAGRRSGLGGVTYLPTWDRHPDYTVLPFGRRPAAPPGTRGDIPRVV